ncbi:MAG TPA: FliM/FliN family flagellar motor switch protein, partial [Acidimicrobiales bacterium]|nr:FliM/FliN family flagellar motor switch protein [Acidimicrobiales bacterium]
MTTTGLPGDVDAGAAGFEPTAAAGVPADPGAVPGGAAVPAPVIPPAPPAPVNVEDDAVLPAAGLPASSPGGARRPFEVLGHVEMSVTVELGRTRMPVRQLLSLAPGSVIELNR